MNRSEPALRMAALLGFLAVVLGAFGAHALKHTLSIHNSTTLWQTAVLYHIVHAVASLWAADRKPPIVWIWTAGIILFSGSLYLLAITGISWLGAITPIGGLLFLGGWVSLAIRSK